MPPPTVPRFAASRLLRSHGLPDMLHGSAAAGRLSGSLTQTQTQEAPAAERGRARREPSHRMQAQPTRPRASSRHRRRARQCTFSPRAEAPLLHRPRVAGFKSDACMTVAGIRDQFTFHRMPRVHCSSAGRREGENLCLLTYPITPTCIACNSI
jgi:hypothetical protein